MSQDLLNRITTLLLRLLGATSVWFSPAGRRWLGMVIGDILRFISSARFHITLDNLVHAFPEKTRQWHQRMARDSYRNLGITLTELLAFPSMSNAEIRSAITYKNIHLIEEGYKEGGGVVLLSAHYGNWELLAFALPLFLSSPVSVIVKPQQNIYADKLLNKYRTRTGNTLIPMHKAARDIVRILSSGGAVALLADQSATSDKDLFVPFFGRPAATYEAPAALALKFNAPIIIGFAERQEDGRYYVDLQSVPHDDLVFNREGIMELTRRHTLLLEEAVRRRPDLWVWQHRRWKHQPTTSE